MTMLDTNPGGRPPLNPTLKPVAVSLRQAGRAIHDIAATLGCAENTVKRWLKEAKDAGEYVPKVYAARRGPEELSSAASTGPVWTPERTERLTAMWAKGHSASDIAHDLGAGISRNAVIGKVSRLGLSGRPNTGHRAPRRSHRARAPKISLVGGKAVEQKLSTNAGTMSRRAAMARERPPEFDTAPQPKAEAWEPLPGTVPVSFAELRVNHCRWPVEAAAPGAHFCGAQQSGSGSYCPTHAVTSYSRRA